MKLSLSKLVLAVSGLALSVSAFSAPNLQPGEVLRKDQTYRSVISTMPPSFDPTIMYDTTSNQILSNTFATLVREDLNGKVVPYAAESWDVSEDGKTYTFHLRKNAKWTNGEPVLAKDFVYAWKRLVDPATISEAQSYLNFVFVVNAADIVANKKPAEQLGVRAVDDYTFEVSLTQPVPWFIPAITYTSLAPVHQATIEKYGSEWVKPENAVSNGPFKLKSVQLNEKIVIEKNPLFWDADSVAITSADYRVISNGVQNYRSFEAGELDIAGVPKTVFDLAEKTGNMRTIESFITQAYAFNLKRPEVQDVRVRKAITLALDNKTIIEKVVRRKQRPALSWTPDYIGEADLIKPAAYNELTQAERNKQAVALLTEAGYSKSKPYEITLTTPSTSDPDIKQRMVAIQSSININTGGLVKVTLDSMEWKVFLEAKNKNELAFFHAGWHADFNHASNFMDLFLPSNATNYSNLDDPTYSNLVEAASKSNDPQERKKLYAKASHELLNVQYALVPFQQSVINQVVSPELKGVGENSLNYYLIDKYFIELSKK